MTGNAQGIGRGGDISLRVGTSKYADGGSFHVTAGNATGNAYVGGTLNLYSGKSDQQSGEINVMTPSSREGGSARTGSITIKTGTSKREQSGALKLETGDG